MNSDSKVGVLDYVILGLILLISVVIGLFQGYHTSISRLYARLFQNRVDNSIDLEMTPEADEKLVESDETRHQQANTETSEYLTGNASMGAVPIAFSLLATFMSTNAVLGYPAEVYQYGVQIWIFAFGIATAPVIAALVIQPYFDKLNITSIFEYIEMRYKLKSLRLLTDVCYIARNFISGALYVLGPSTALTLILHLDKNFSIAMICAIGTFYTCIGGIKAVIWTDLFQGLIMVVCLLIVAVNGIVDEDGLANIFSRANEGGRLALFDFNLDMFTRQTFWTLYFGGIFLSSVTYCFDQIGLQRFQAAKTKRQAKLSVLLNVPGTFLFISLCCFSGLIIYAKYQNCDPLYKKNITNANQYLSYYVLENFYTIPGMIGIYLGGVFCSSLSSLSSYLNSQAAIIFQDFFLLFNYFRSLNDKARLQVNKLIVLVCGCVVAALTYVISSSGNNLIQLSSAFNGTFNAPIVGLFLLSLFFSVVNKHGALGGFVIGLCVNCWINVGSLLERPVYPPLDVSIFGCPNNDSMLNSTTINFNYMKVEPVGFNKFYALANSFYTAFGAIVTVVAGLLISVFTGGLHNRVDESLLIFDLTWFLNRKTYT